MRYPSRSGLALPPDELGFTHVEQQRRLTSNHHRYFPRVGYSDVGYRHVFRNLVINVSPLLIEEHTELHKKYKPPVPPRDILMIDVVEEYLATHGVIECVREHKTNETYEIGQVR